MEATLVAAAATQRLEESTAVDAMAPPLSAKAVDPEANMIADKSGWQFSGRLSGVSAHFEQAQSLLADGSGTITLAERSGVRTGRLEADHAVVSDLLKEARFRPLNLDGAMDLSGEDWRGTFALAARGRRFASVAVHHDMCLPGSYWAFR